MFDSAAAHLLLIFIVAASILLMLVRPRGIAEAWWVGGGAALLIALRLISLQLAGRAIAEGADVYLFLTGMMLLSELARLYGVFDWMASAAADHAQGSAVRLFTLIFAVGTLVTVFMSNDATAVVLTPAVLAAVRKAKAKPLPYLFGCALIANAASFMLPISNPANLVVFRTQMPDLVHWLARFGLASILAIASTYAALRWYFRRELRQPVAENEVATHLIGNGRFVLFGIVVVIGIMLGSSAAGTDLGLPTFSSAVIITLIVVIKSRTSVFRILREISWSVLPLVGGLFILVEAMNSVGAMRLAVSALQWAEGLSHAVGTLVAGTCVAVANNLVNNLPLGLIAGSALNATHAHGAVANAVLIAIDLGPNLSVTGSLATILWLIALRREGMDISFWTFLKVGCIVMPVSLFLALAGSILMGRG